MWCKYCNRETDDPICSTCGNPTSNEINHAVFWCEECNIPFVSILKKGKKYHQCPSCKTKTDLRVEDLRPVFPEERLLFELMTGQEPLSLYKSSVWKAGSRYIVDGKFAKINSALYDELDVTKYIDQLEKFQEKNIQISYEFFNKHIDKFIETNNEWLNRFTQEAVDWVKDTRDNPKYKNMNFMVSFSGGKDSTAVSDVVMKALGNPRVLHMFGNTTLEFPTTYQYVEDYKQEHPFTPIRTVVNYDQQFLDLVDEIGPPARLMRWCCSMFKTGPITRKLNQICRVHEDDEDNQHNHIFTFYGIRKNESVSRSKYNRISGSDDSVKIRKQIVGSPIFFWKDVDVWLYLLANKVLFNYAYRLGYDRVGCWCCPNNNQRSQFLARIYMPDQSKEWRDKLIEFAKKVGKPDPEVYVDTGAWKARQGGNGVAAASEIKIKYSNCTTEDNAKIYQLNKPLSEEFYNMLIPFGIVKEGRKSLDEMVVYHPVTSMQILSIVPFSQKEYLYSVKVKVMNVENVDELFRMVGYQIRKFNVCKKCLKCESICQFGAISITPERGYKIDKNKCRHCLMCVNQNYLPEGCLMGRYLRVKDEN